MDKHRKPVVMQPPYHDNRIALSYTLHCMTSEMLLSGVGGQSHYIYIVGVSTPLLHGGLKRGLASPRASTPALQLINLVHPVGMMS